jgi:[NiFe] hydrogenase assembly HybE family chaperone
MSNYPNASALIAVLESTFNTIQSTRMQGIPILNPKLHVKAEGFKRWNKGRLGILLTPWFMNVMFVPENELTAPVGSKPLIQLPSGCYECIVGYEDPIGLYLSSSLFSPMFEFEDQLAAEQTAKAALIALMTEETASPSKPSDIPESTAAQPLSQRLEQPLSRREWLQGRFIRGST